MGRRGVRAGKNTIQIDFRYKGSRCRESLKLSPTPKNMKYAENLRHSIKHDIGQGTFDYSRYFPDSPRCALFCSTRSTQKTVGQLLNTWIETSKKQLAHSTHKEYENAINHYLIPSLGSIPAATLNTNHVKSWIGTLEVKNKTINNILTPLRQCLADAYADGMIERNPMDRVKNLKVTTPEPDPFTPEEIVSVLAKLTGQARNLFQFAFWTGLRTSELIALTWDDAGSDHIRVRRARVRRRTKETKTSAGYRDVKLLPDAQDALQAQKQYTFLAGKAIFHNPRTDRPWVSDKALREVDWTQALKQAGVRYRNPYQTRHTYASMLLMAGENPMWVARQMGHENMIVLLKRYARWMPDADSNAGNLVTAWSKNNEGK